MKKFNRRDFLKFASLFSTGLAFQRFTAAPAWSQQNAGEKNIIIVVLDALSAYNITLHGYARDTMPNLAKLAEKAVVYHNHYAAGNFTTPGTASLLTGTLPWSHRALKYNGKPSDEYKSQNIFHVFPQYHRMAYSHNRWVNTILKQFWTDVDFYTPQGELFLEYDRMVEWLFDGDEDAATLSWSRAIKQNEFGYSYSLFFPQLYNAIKKGRISSLSKEFPRGLPNVMPDNYFLLEQAVDYLGSYLLESPQPFLGYYHFLPPHDPYNTREEFYGRFMDDGHRPIEKPNHFFSKIKTYQELSKLCTWYDEFILYADAEFARFYKNLEQSGLLENTWLILTSDHGEMFERGTAGHQTRLLHQPVVRIPLLIFEPGLKTRMDVYANTSAIDVLPTLLNVTDQEIPDWIEGQVLPPYSGDTQKPDRDIFALQSRRTKPGKPITEGTAMVVKENYKLIYFWGYKELGQGGELIELYDIKSDPNELNNLYPARKSIADELVGIVKARIKQSQ